VRGTSGSLPAQPELRCKDRVPKVCYVLARARGPLKKRTPLNFDRETTLSASRSTDGNLAALGSSAATLEWRVFRKKKEQAGRQRTKAEIGSRLQNHPFARSHAKELNERSKTPLIASPFHDLVKRMSHDQNAESNFSHHIQLRAGPFNLHFLLCFAQHTRNVLKAGG
jgi:hypothetical protein